jgi:hypothetical protein
MKSSHYRVEIAKKKNKSQEGKPKFANITRGKHNLTQLIINNSQVQCDP